MGTSKAIQKRTIGFIIEETTFDQSTGKFVTSVKQELSDDFKIVDANTGAILPATLSYEDGVMYAAIEASVPEYEGSYTVTENQVLAVEGLKMTQDLTIDVDVPEYDGPYTVTENVTLPVAGLKMAQDLVINVAGGGPSYALIDNEYGKTIVFTATYASIANDYGTTLII